MEMGWQFFKKSIDDLINLDLTEKAIREKWSDINIRFKNYKPNHLVAFLYILKKKIFQ